MVNDTCAENKDRTLIYIPILHSKADLGTLADAVECKTRVREGNSGWRRHSAQIEQVWTDIETLLNKLTLNYSHVRLYQDGLPICGREAEIVADLARVGSRNHALLLRLMERGATLMGTESPHLLLEEYEQVKIALACDSKTAGHSSPDGANVHSSKPASPLSNSASLLQKRDLFIAERINQTLREGETGLVFLGLLHSLKDRLAVDIHLLTPLAMEGEKIHELL